ncbi:hypothetical protein D8O27_30495 [Burkholderia mallei]|nr:hypothetical protein D8O31_30750 [Burkholderia mallei]RKO04524.1 hypothetical protein D8O04_30060 [Burkholderia mallei]RKO09766.1 hypothetical protein D8O30_30665 [Burkholderia mallei]RKO18196.1 hypothetical protein D8O27_30495 [Burkholderia mallei]RKO28693.1 hypothetical protein D8O06_30650 [Burkholderia mallei]
MPPEHCLRRFLYAPPPFKINALPARRSARYVGLRDSAGTIPLLKPHGSVNWVQADDGTDLPPSIGPMGF